MTKRHTRNRARTTPARRRWTSSQLRIAGSFFDAGGLTNCKVVHGCRSVLTTRKRMAHNAIVVVLREACFSLRR